ncbi:MAG: hypothetical protein K6G18_02145 [Treponema sp.]|nr:hypothetical protein [Treponema sp.]
MTQAEQAKAAKEFAEFWADKDGEKQYCPAVLDIPPAGRVRRGAALKYVYAITADRRKFFGRMSKFEKVIKKHKAKEDRLY